MSITVFFLAGDCIIPSNILYLYDKLAMVIKKMYAASRTGRRGVSMTRLTSVKPTAIDLLLVADLLHHTLYDVAVVFNGHAGAGGPA
jgi:hypothetical protein